MSSVSVVIPVYNAELSLENLYGQLMPAMEATTAQFEVIMVEDHGEDDSWSIISKLAEQEESFFLEDIRQKFNDGIFFPAIELFMPWYREKMLFPPDLLPEKLTLIECEPEQLKDRRELFLEEILDGYQAAMTKALAATLRCLG